ncbi:MAG: hypothetical protein ACLR4A_15065 [Christensenellales bacterium]
MKEVRFGLIGLGAMGMAHAKTLLSSVPDARLCAAVTTSEAHKAEMLALPARRMCAFSPQLRRCTPAG